jgi:hypothetical protein
MDALKSVADDKIILTATGVLQVIDGRVLSVITI